MSNHNESNADDTPPMVHDESNWLVSYADMMTLLFGFFVLMYSLSRVDQDKYAIIQKDIAKFLGKEGSVVTPNYKAGKIKKLETLFAEDGLIKGPTQDFDIRGQEDGSILLKMKDAVLFAPGSDQLSPLSQETLEKLAKTLTAFKDLSGVNIEGHTDDSPISSERFPSNWELSSARSARIARLFKDNQLVQPKIVAEGYADSQPIAPNRDEKGQPIQENRTLNRRVVVRLKFERNPASSPENSKLLKKLGAEIVPAKPKPELQSSPEPIPNDAQALEERYKEAQVRLEEAKKKLRQSEEEKRKKQRLEDLERQIQEVEGRLKEPQDAPTGTAPTGTAPTGTAPTGNVPTGTAPSGNVPKGNPASSTPSTKTPVSGNPTTNTTSTKGAAAGSPAAAPAAPPQRGGQR